MPRIRSFVRCAQAEVHAPPTEDRDLRAKAPCRDTDHLKLRNGHQEEQVAELGLRSDLVVPGAKPLREPLHRGEQHFLDSGVWGGQHAIADSLGLTLRISLGAKRRRFHTRVRPTTSASTLFHQIW